MGSENRAKEYNPRIIEDLKGNYSKVITIKGKPLEGTGSLVIDVQNRQIFCCISKRADEKTLNKFMDAFNKNTVQKYNKIRSAGAGKGRDPKDTQMYK